MTNAVKLDMPAFVGWIFDLPPLAALIFALLVTPGMMFIIGNVLESRVLPVWNGQFRGFIPGDLFLGGAFACIVALVGRMPEERDTWYQSTQWHLAVLVVCVAGGLLARKFLDSPLYELEALRSPTKIYHDVALYMGYAWLLVSAGAPALIYAAGGLGYRVALVALALAWAACVFVWDGVFRNTAELARTAHTADWMIMD